MSTGQSSSSYGAQHAVESPSDGEGSATTSDAELHHSQPLLTENASSNTAIAASEAGEIWPDVAGLACPKTGHRGVLDKRTFWVCQSCSQESPIPKDLPKRTCNCKPTESCESCKLICRCIQDKSFARSCEACKIHAEKWTKWSPCISCDKMLTDHEAHYPICPGCNKVIAAVWVGSDDAVHDPSRGRWIAIGGRSATRKDDEKGYRHHLRHCTGFELMSRCPAIPELKLAGRVLNHLKNDIKGKKPVTGNKEKGKEPVTEVKKGEDKTVKWKNDVREVVEAGGDPMLKITDKVKKRYRCSDCVKKCSKYRGSGKVDGCYNELEDLITHYLEEPKHVLWNCSRSVDDELETIDLPGRKSRWVMSAKKHYEGKQAVEKFEKDNKMRMYFPFLPPVPASFPVPVSAPAAVETDASQLANAHGSQLPMTNESMPHPAPFGLVMPAKATLGSAESAASTQRPQAQFTNESSSGTGFTAQSQEWHFTSPSVLGTELVDPNVSLSGPDNFWQPPEPHPFADLQFTGPSNYQVQAQSEGAQAPREMISYMTPAPETTSTNQIPFQAMNDQFTQATSISVRTIAPVQESSLPQGPLISPPTRYGSLALYTHENTIYAIEPATPLWFSLGPTDTWPNHPQFITTAENMGVLYAYHVDIGRNLRIWALRRTDTQPLSGRYDAVVAPLENLMWGWDWERVLP